jgi:hypothetical protein
MLTKIAREEKCSRDKAKTKVIAVINGAIYKSNTLKNLAIELSPIIKHIINLPEYISILADVRTHYGNVNYEGKTISRVLQVIENQMLELYTEFFTAKGFVLKYFGGYAISLIFDGLQLELNPNITDELLNECRLYALQKTGYDIQLKIKPFDNCLKLPDDYAKTFNPSEYKTYFEEKKEVKSNINIIDGGDDDEGAADIVVKNINHLLVKCDGNIFIKHNNIWIGDEKEVNVILSNHIVDLNIRFISPVNASSYSYSRAIKHQRNCIACIRNNPTIKTDNSFIQNTLDSSLGYLPFTNGIYSFKDKKLYPYSDLPNISFFFIIDRELKPRNDANYEIFMKKIIEPIYPNYNERRFNAEVIARAIAGCVQDKRYYLRKGERDSGKGLETGLLTRAFGRFVQSFDTSVLVYNKFKVADAKSLSWVVPKRYSRLALGNEVDAIDGKDDILLNSKLVKQLVSGGDEIEARQNYKDEMTFKIGFTVMIFSNNSLSFTTKDANQNLITFEYKSKFVSEDKLIEGCEYYKLRDDNIKSFSLQDDMVDCYTWYILDNYNDIIPSIPEEVQLATETQIDAEELTVEQFVLKTFITTKDKADRFHIDRLKDILMDNGFNSVVITTIFTKLNLGSYSKSITIDGVKKRGFYCLKQIDSV